MAWTAPRTWVTDEDIDAAIMNTHVRDNFKAIGDAWQSYTPTFTNLTVGTSAVTGNYIQAGKLVVYRGSITLASGFSISGTVSVSVPAAMIATTYPIGGAGLFDTSATAYRWWAAMGTTSTTLLFADQSDSRVNATVPWTWAIGDIMRWQVTYEAS